MPAQTIIKFRRDTAANWATTNPTLAAGEVGLETDSGLVKYGNGTSAWADLQYTTTASIRTKVQNATGSAITKGSVVYINGANGDNPTIALADADTEATSSKTLGIVTADIANGAQGYVIESGLITNINTAAASAGQSVWLSSTAGGFVFGAPPAKPAHSVYLGVVTRANTNNGTILVKVQNGYELNELHDVNAGSPAVDDILQWNGTAWVNATPPVGPQGEPGPPGNDGINGVDGVNGTDGEQGPPGADGADGADGQSVLFRGDYDSEITYNAGDIVKTPISGTGQDPYPLQPLYVSLIDSNLDNTPDSSPSAWSFLVNDVLQAALDAKLSATITSPVTGQTIQYNGTTWVNAAAAATGETISSFLLMGA
jgi:hypothetical protein